MAKGLKMSMREFEGTPEEVCDYWNIPRQSTPKNRKCLKCDKQFFSKKGERSCTNCHFYAEYTFRSSVDVVKLDRGRN